MQLILERNQSLLKSVLDAIASGDQNSLHQTNNEAETASAMPSEDARAAPWPAFRFFIPDTERKQQMERLKPLRPEELTPEQQEVHAVIASGPRGQVRGPLAMWLHRPGLAHRAQALGQYCRYDSSLPPRLSELAILVMARTWMSEFEWWAHKPIALKAGVAEEVVEAIRRGCEPVFGNEEEQVIYEFLTVLHATRSVPDKLYQRAMTVLGKDRVVDLVGLAGYYTLISMTINVFGVAPPDGSAPELV